VVWATVLALVLVRLIFAAVIPLAFDEAYYWTWSKHLAGGYYDHPPMVAVVIRLGTLLAGDTELGVRVISVLMAIPATWAVWRSAAVLFADERVAATAALLFNLTLIVAAGTLIVTPDAPLLVASSFVLFFLAKVLETDRGEWWLAAGAAAGAALLAKYSALFLGVSIVVWLLVVPELRRWFRSPWLWVGGIIALSLFMPVIIWNAHHEWVSFIKQFGRAAVHDWTLRFLGEHSAAQIGLATPPIFVLGIMGLVAFLRGRGGGRSSARTLLGALVWPLTLYFLWHALHARVQGNWTAPVFPAFAVAAAVAAHGIDWTGRWAKLAAWSRRLATPVGLSLITAAYVQAAFGIVPLGLFDPTARQLGAGWRTLGAEIDAIRKQVGAGAVLNANYAETAWLAFYLRSRPPVVELHERIRWINAPEPPRELFEGPLLYVCGVPCDDMGLITSRYARSEEIARIPRMRRGVVLDTYAIYRVQGLRGDPLDRTPPPELRR
jgi:4-amino-4-deoxy-L-arabinose transferase-like glycosyltransferase